MKKVMVNILGQKCPYCKSFNTEKYTTIKFGYNMKKEYGCQNCGKEFGKRIKG